MPEYGGATYLGVVPLTTPQPIDKGCTVLLAKLVAHGGAKAKVGVGGR
jgi:hypothetical protein